MLGFFIFFARHREKARKRTLQFGNFFIVRIFNSFDRESLKIEGLKNVLVFMDAFCVFDICESLHLRAEILDRF
jgi:hypothetical protein